MSTTLTRAPEIVVGVDGSSAAGAALKWALAEAVRRHGRLSIVTAYESMWPGAELAVDGGYEQLIAEQAQSLVDDAIKKAKTIAPELSTQGRTVHGQPGSALMEASQEAAVLVVGNRGRGGFASLLLGSVGYQVATHASCPVVVVRGRVDAMGPVMVGVDGSPSASHALGSGFELARARGNRLIAVHAFRSYLPTWGSQDADAVPYMTDPTESEKVELDLLYESVNPWRDKYPDVEVEFIVHQGHPAQLLARMSHSTSLVVVGSRGHGGFAGLLLGSVALHLLHHSACPVMIDRVAATRGE